MISAIEPQRIALRFTPPGIIVEYAYTQSCQASALYHHEIDLQDELLSYRGSIDETAIREIVRSLIRQHDQVLGNHQVSVQQLQRLVRKLVDQVASPASPQRTDPSPSVILPQADYNRVSETQLKQVKAKMDELFEQNLVRPGQADFQYDKQIAFEPPQEASDWDD